MIGQVSSYRFDPDTLQTGSIQYLTANFSCSIAVLASDSTVFGKGFLDIAAGESRDDQANQNQNIRWIPKEKWHIFFFLSIWRHCIKRQVSMYIIAQSD